MPSLPASLPPPPVLAPNTVTCALCTRQFAKYTCPACNAPYCSLPCFRSPAHAQCSEGFYKKEVEADIRVAPGKSAAERRRMMELLRRFEEESAASQSTSDGALSTSLSPSASANADPDFNSDEDEDDEADALAPRLAHLDLESTPPSALWALLPRAARARFLRAMGDPSSPLARELLAAASVGAGVVPWWEVASASDASAEGIPAPTPEASAPPPIALPPALTAPAPAPAPAAARALIYNIAALLIAYAYTTRHLGRARLSSSSSSPSPPPFSSTAPAPASNPNPNPPANAPNEDEDEARTLLTSLTPFLTARADTTRHPDLGSALTALRSRMPEDTPLAPLLRDAAALLRTPLVVELASPSDAESPSPASPADGAHKSASAPSAPPAFPADVQASRNPDAQTIPANSQTSQLPALRALGDLHALFRAPRVRHKLVFYGAALVAAFAPVRDSAPAALREAAPLRESGEVREVKEAREGREVVAELERAAGEEGRLERERERDRDREGGAGGGFDVGEERKGRKGVRFGIEEVGGGEDGGSRVT
ncbi:hypothetical protein DFH09DRAFT_1273806 [Mycena vulgaris]|nr:hypothetical protein DFH09DRAFT_1273806 [Mycena vulgaris]